MGQALWAYNGLVRGERTPSPSPVDLGYLAIIPLLFAGLVTLVGGAPRGAGRLKVVLDAVIAMASIATLSWFAVLGPLYVLADNTVLAKVFSLFLPAGDTCCTSSLPKPVKKRDLLEAIERYARVHPAGLPVAVVA